MDYCACSKDNLEASKTGNRIQTKKDKDREEEEMVPKHGKQAGIGGIKRTIHEENQEDQRAGGGMGRNSPGALTQKKHKGWNSLEQDDNGEEDHQQFQRLQ